jgi:hypothetical protein
VSVFSVAAIVLIPLACKRKIASLMCSTLQIGILNSCWCFYSISIYWAEPAFCTIIPFTPVHSAVLMIAPNFASEIWKYKKIMVFRFQPLYVKVSKSKGNRRDATAVVVRLICLVFYRNIRSLHWHASSLSLSLSLIRCSFFLNIDFVYCSTCLNSFDYCSNPKYDVLFPQRYKSTFWMEILIFNRIM